MRSELFNNKMTSLGHSHLREPEVVIQVASCGELQLSFGKTSPPNLVINEVICDSNSGNCFGATSCRC